MFQWINWKRKNLQNNWDFSLSFIFEQTRKKSNIFLFFVFKNIQRNHVDNYKNQNKYYICYAKFYNHAKYTAYKREFAQLMHTNIIVTAVNYKRHKKIPRITWNINCNKRKAKRWQQNKNKKATEFTEKKGIQKWHQQMTLRTMHLRAMSGRIGNS